MNPFAQTDYDSPARLIPDYGDVFTMQEFTEMAHSGAVSSDDGSGHYSDGKQMFHQVDFSNLDRNYSHVVWFNK
jgi:hypothetical protein